MRKFLNAHILVGLIALNLCDLVVGQSDGKKVDELIANIFTKPTDSGNQEINLNPSPATDTGTANCECVAYYLCNNNTIIQDGFGIIDIRIDDGPCDYLSVCCGKDETVTEPLTPKPDIDRPGCGRRNPQGVGFRITGANDHEAQFGEFPWMVALLREESIEGNPKKLLIYQCGGSLIHPQVVLTAAHCVHDKTKQYKIRAGEWDTQTKNELYPHQDRDVKQVISHKNYYAGALFYDFALLILESPLEITENVDVACLPEANMNVDNLRCLASGWGKDVFGKEGKYQVILKKIELPIVPWATCQDRLRTTRLGKHFKLHETFICAGGEPDQDTCKGDGGSPLVCPTPGNDKKYFQAGIVAWGIGCGENLIPGVMSFLLLLFAVLSCTLVQAQEDKVQEAIDKIFTTGNFFDQFEEVTTQRSSGFGAEQRCGEDADAGVHRCVRYFNCDSTTKMIIASEDYDGSGLIDIRFGNNNCDNYLDVCCGIPPGGVPPEVTQRPDEVTPIPPTLAPNTPSFCGIRNTNGVDFKITGNHDGEAEFGEFPWMCVILKKTPTADGTSAVCGCSLIAPNVILTGAHCVENIKSSDIKIRAGEWDTQTERERYVYQERDIKQVITHEGFKLNNLFNDVALLVLETPFDKALHIGTICLPQYGTVFNSKECFASGWGKDVFGQKGRYQVILKKIQLPTVPRNKCENDLRKTRLGPKFYLHQSFICAGGETGKDTCTGDGGSPLVCPDPANPKRYYQAGIVAWGIGCGQENIPGVYVDVASFRNWIDGHMARLEMKLPQVGRKKVQKFHSATAAISLEDSRGGEISTKKTRTTRNNTKQIAYVSTYNIRTMNNEKRMTELEKELNGINWDILGLSETSIKGENYNTLKSEYILFHKKTKNYPQSKENGHGMFKNQIDYIITYKKQNKRCISVK
ncbi:hypothetical protein FQA39_LY00862 [Lamprigera yunnana]|nr:hypothetical protein FQA39_LY00862 [Lamprigera yunnana]